MTCSTLHNPNALVSSIVSGNANGIFATEVLNGVTVTVNLVRELDYETTQVHKLEIRARDGPVGELWDEELTIVVLDVNDNFPVCDKTIYQVSLGEYTPKYTEVLKLNCSDDDVSSDYNTLIYRIKGSSQEFGIDSTTGVITNSKALNGSDKPYNLTIDVSDGNNPTEITVLINHDSSPGNSTDSIDGDNPKGNSTGSVNECNGGIAIPLNEGVQCLCPPHKQGPNCTDDVPDVESDCEWPSNEDACSTEPCYGEGAVCINTFGENFKCLCPPGMEGDRCNTGSHCFSCSSVRWRNVTCSVFDDASFLREMDFSGPPTVTTRMSRTKCTNDKWGFDDGNGDMWVAKGCRAKFCIEFEKSVSS
ncbi:unnamed protein product [Owenia fusiformis]|uniref:Uncharacterized protein n=1 Tax=Owenia fusiformis TaxID=6347 RepID=A0A8S4PVA2_OWEFU|nr:unnamed protein product [Owenia fusiformis]